MRCAKKIKVKIVSVFNYDFSSIDGIEDYLRQIYKSKGIVHEAKLFDKNVVALIKSVDPPDAYTIDDNTKIEIIKPARRFLLYIF